LQDPTYLVFVVDQKKRLVVHTSRASLQITQAKDRRG
jgi:hypothetical protein